MSVASKCKSKNEKAKEVPSFIRATSHPLSLANTAKLDTLAHFLKAYRNAVDFYVNYLWLNRISWQDNNGNSCFFDIANDDLDIPLMLSTVGITFKTPLSARALKCAMTQALGMLRAATEKRRKRLFVLAEMKANGCNCDRL